MSRFLTRVRHLSSAAMVILTTGGAVHAAPCPVPSASHPTIQAALDDLGCSEITLAAQVFDESPVVARTVEISGAGTAATTIAGRVEVTAGECRVRDLTIRQDQEAGGPVPDVLWAHSGATVSGLDVDVEIAFGTPLFADGFESGTTTAWSATLP